MERPKSGEINVWCACMFWIMSRSEKHGGGSVMAWASMAASGVGSLIFIDDVTYDGSSRMNSEMYKNMLGKFSFSLFAPRWALSGQTDPQQKQYPIWVGHFICLQNGAKLAGGPSRILLLIFKHIPGSFYAKIPQNLCTEACLSKTTNSPVTLHSVPSSLQKSSGLAALAKLFTVKISLNSTQGSHRSK